MNRSSLGRVSSGSGGLFTKARAGLAHTSTIPSLLGNPDLKLLQSLITDEKAVLAQHDRLAQDTTKAATALAAWGESEGDDLADVSSRASDLLACLSEAYTVFGERTTHIRALFKASA